MKTSREFLARMVTLVAFWLGSLTLSHAAAQTSVQLVFDSEIARSGQTVMAGVHLKMQPGWHSYWRNSGDSGIPTTVEWKLPAGVSAGELRWPAPEKLEEAGFTTYVYHDEVVLLAPLTLASNLANGPLELKAKVEWQECKEVCVQGSGEFSATLRIGAEARAAADAALIGRFQKRLPVPGVELKAHARWDGLPKGEKGDERALAIEFNATGDSANWDFFPYKGKSFEVGGDTKASGSGGSVTLRKNVTKSDGPFPAEIAGLLVQQDQQKKPVAAYEVTLPVAEAPPKGGSLWLMLFFGFIGGFILNFMPCVLPVIALKVLSFVGQSKETPARVRALGMVYGVGVLLSFLVLALLAIAVIKAGGLASWGMVLQNQPFRVVMTVLITLVALNLFGLFEVTPGSRVMDAAGGLSAKKGYPGAFFNGVLATILATPCTAPFLGGALAFAFTQPPLVIVLVFLAAGAGLAFPFVVLCWQPAWLKLMPKPGVWMERFKVAMGFPMLATAIWMFWFTAPRFGKSGVLWLGLFLVTLAMGAWVWGEFVQRSTSRRAFSILCSLILIAGGYFFFLERELHWRTAVLPLAGGSLQHGPDGIEWQLWSPEAVEAARAAGHPVLVDFTADNCLNCQVNKATSLEIPATRVKLKDVKAVAFLGDFTDQDRRIARVLQEYQRPGVPLVIVYPKNPQAAPLVLPPILTPSIVLNALDEAAK